MIQTTVSLVIMMALSAFFSGMEIAFVSSNRLLAEMEKERRGPGQRAIAFFYRHPNDFISTMLVGNNIALVVYGILFAKIFDSTLFAPLSDGGRVVADTLLSTLVVLFTGEFLPKTLFKTNPNTWLTVFALPAMLCYVLLYPVSRFATLMSKLLMRMFGLKTGRGRDESEFTKVDLDYLVKSSIDNAQTDDDVNDEVKIFHNALDFTDTKVRDCMVPRTELATIDIETGTVEELRRLFIESGYSKIIVYKGDIDHVVGYIHSSEMFRSPQQWKERVRPLLYVPETMAAGKLLHTFLAQKKTLGLVVDEFGGTGGLVSLEDIVEEIFGEIQDEHDTTTYVAKRTDNGDYVMSARLETGRANELLGLDLPESEDYVTVGGFILHHYQSFPQLNEVVTIGKYEFKIVKSTQTRIELVRLRVRQ